MGGPGLAEPIWNCPAGRSRCSGQSRNRGFRPGRFVSLKWPSGKSKSCASPTLDRLPGSEPGSWTVCRRGHGTVIALRTGSIPDGHTGPDQRVQRIERGNIVVGPVAFEASWVRVHAPQTSSDGNPRSWRAVQGLHLALLSQEKPGVCPRGFRYRTDHSNFSTNCLSLESLRCVPDEASSHGPPEIPWGRRRYALAHQVAFGGFPVAQRSKSVHWGSAGFRFPRTLNERDLTVASDVQLGAIS